MRVPGAKRMSGRWSVRVLAGLALAVAAAVVMLAASRWFFLRSLRSYRSASS